MTAALTTDELWTSDFPGLTGAALELARKVPRSKGKSFSQYWADHFPHAIAARDAVPNRITPESVLDLFPVRSRGSWFFTAARDIDGDLADHGFSAEPGVVYAQLHTRQGGGNRDCWCDTDEGHEDFCLAVNNEELQSHRGYILDYDDSGDSTYANFIYRTDLTESDLRGFAEINALVDRISLEHAAIERVNALEDAPWSILGIFAESRETDVIKRLSAAKRELEAARRDANPAALSYAEQLLTTASTLLSGGTVDAEALYGKDARVISQKLGVREWNYGLQRILDLFVGLSKHNAELAVVQARFDQASELPEGSELWNYLLKDRGTGSYSTTEKQGRRNVKVERSYARGSLLGSELKTAQGHVDDRAEQLERYIGEVQSRRDVLAEVQDSIGRLTAEIEELEAESWSAGWPGSGKAPAAPVEAQV